MTTDLDDGASSRSTPSASPRPIDAAPEHVADRLDIDAALGRLPVEFRVPVVLRDLYGLDYAEIAEICDVPGGTVRSRIARGRAILEDLLAPGNQTADLDVEGGDHD